MEKIIFLNEQVMLDNHERLIMPKVKNLVDTYMLIQSEFHNCDRFALSQCLSSAGAPDEIQSLEEFDLCANQSNCALDMVEEVKERIDWGDLPEKLNTTPL